MILLFTKAMTPFEKFGICQVAATVVCTLALVFSSCRLNWGGAEPLDQHRPPSPSSFTLSLIPGDWLSSSHTFGSASHPCQSAPGLLTLEVTALKSKHWLVSGECFLCTCFSAASALQGRYSATLFPPSRPMVKFFAPSFRSFLENGVDARGKQGARKPEDYRPDWS